MALPATTTREANAAVRVLVRAERDIQMKVAPLARRLNLALRETATIGTSAGGGVKAMGQAKRVAPLRVAPTLKTVSPAPRSIVSETRNRVSLCCLRPPEGPVSLWCLFPVCCAVVRVRTLFFLAFF